MSSSFISPLCYNRGLQFHILLEASLVRIHHIATLFGLGRHTRAPGTLGSLAAVPLWFLLAQLHPYAYLAVVLLIIGLGVAVSSYYVQHHGVEDPSEVVIDEVAGFLIAMTWLPPHWTYLLLGFALFRLLDVVKPFPISVLDRRVKGGLGVMADDMLAGLLANAVLQWLHQSQVVPWLP